MSYRINTSSSQPATQQWRAYLQKQTDLTQAVRMQAWATIGAAYIQHRATKNLSATVEKGLDKQIQKAHEDALAIASRIDRNADVVIRQSNEIRESLDSLQLSLDVGLGALADQLRIANSQSMQLVELMHVPDFQKERRYFIDQGLKHYANARIDPSLYGDALEALLEAEAREKTDFVVLHRIGMIYLYSPYHADLGKAKEYFLRAAKYSRVELSPAYLRLLDAACKPPSFGEDSSREEKLIAAAFSAKAREYFVDTIRRDLFDIDRNELAFDLPAPRLPYIGEFIMALEEELGSTRCQTFENFFSLLDIGFISARDFYSLPDREDVRLIYADSYESVAFDPLYEAAELLVMQASDKSTVQIDRELKIGPTRAENLINELENRGVLSPANPDGTRYVFVQDITIKVIYGKARAKQQTSEVNGVPAQFTQELQGEMSLSETASVLDRFIRFVWPKTESSELAASPRTLAIDSYRLASICAQNLGESESSAFYASEALCMGPFNSPARLQLVNALTALREVDEAEERFYSLITDDPLVAESVAYDEEFLALPHIQSALARRSEWLVYVQSKMEQLHKVKEAERVERLRVQRERDAEVERIKAEKRAKRAQARLKSDAAKMRGDENQSADSSSVKGGDDDASSLNTVDEKATEASRTGVLGKIWRRLRQNDSN